MSSVTVQLPDALRQQIEIALCQRLGRADMIRFLQQFEAGRGDYAEERHAWVDRLTLDEIGNLASKTGEPSQD